MLLDKGMEKYKWTELRNYVGTEQAAFSGTDTVPGSAAMGQYGTEQFLQNEYLENSSWLTTAENS